VTGRWAATGAGLVLGTAGLVWWGPPGGSLWPPLVALVVILTTRRALVGLLAGGVAGAVLLHGGDPVQAGGTIAGLLADSFHSPWKVGALVFTLLLGGFAAVLESAGGLETLLRRWARDEADTARGVETAAGLLGIVCFFDGLANSLVVGRVSRSLADRHGVARVKLAYIVDSTSSAVACVAVISTWIAFQLSMIDQAFAAAGRPANPYLVFLSSLPANFYCWFTFAMLAAAVRFRFHPGPMGPACALAARDATAEKPGGGVDGRAGPWRTAALPLVVLMVGFLAGFILLGAPRPLWPLTREGIVAAFGSDAGPRVLVLSSLVALAVSVAVHPGGLLGRRKAVGAAGRGMAAMAPPLLILLAAWIMGGVMDRLGTADLIAGLTSGSDLLWVMPTVTFITGSLISFSTGTSWGTMGIMFPLAVPAAAVLGADAAFLNLMVAAVFSGAVFGDHCSPFSDTTIVTSLSCGVTPHDHVRTQLPYALLTAGVAIACGFVPAGLGVPAWVCLLMGGGLILGLGRRFGRRPHPAI